MTIEIRWITGPRACQTITADFLNPIYVLDPKLSPRIFESAIGICFSICFKGPRRQPTTGWALGGSCSVDVFVGPRELIWIS